jgi:GT2 family glycosyltransferase
MAAAPYPGEMSVVICAYTLDRWPDLQAAVKSVLDQQHTVERVIVVIDHNPELLDRAQIRWPAIDTTASGAVVQVVASRGLLGLSGARNTGVAVATTEIVAFLDDDAVADPTWTQWLLAPYSDQDVIACGGAAVPALDGRRPRWWPLEFDWVVGCSYVGLPSRQAEVRNLIGANMSLRRQAAVDIGGFVEGIGRVGSRPLGCEETDLFIRLSRRWPHTRVVYEPRALVHHRVPTARLTWRYYRARCFAEGLSKAKVAAHVGRDRALASERSYVCRVLPRAVARACLGAGDAGNASQAIAISVGLLVTTAGYASGHLAAIRPPFSPTKKLAA